MTDAPDASPGRVLVIDDDHMVGHMLVAHIRAAGYDAKVTDSPKEFFALVRSWQPTHVFIDLVMGDTDGLEVLSMLAEAGSQAAVVIQSGMGGRVLEAARQFASAHGLVYAGVLNKPFTRADVAAVLSKAPQHPQLQSESDHDALGTWSAREFEAALRAAGANGEITVAFQPIVACADGHVVGYEALARWRHPDLGIVAPAAFIPRAESVGLVSIVTDCVAREALMWFGRERAERGERLSINISASEFTDKSLDGRLRSLCHEAHVEPGSVVLEVTETSAMGDPTVTLEVLTRLRLEGFQLSIDDFGTGYSSMSQLARMPFTEVKVDRSFVHNLAESAPAEVMVTSMLQLSKGLGLESTAEGVEDARCLEVLTRLGCDYAQGYHIAMPMAAPELAAWLADAD